MKSDSLYRIEFRILSRMMGRLRDPLLEEPERKANEVHLIPAVGLRQYLVHMPPGGRHFDVCAVGVLLKANSLYEGFGHSRLGGRELEGLPQEGLGHRERGIVEADLGRHPGLEP
jgi:hypothetical protein